MTGPARYWSADQTADILGNSNRRDELLVAEIRKLRSEVEGLRAEARSTAVSAGRLYRIADKHDQEGTPPVRPE